MQNKLFTTAKILGVGGSPHAGIEEIVLREDRNLGEGRSDALSLALIAPVRRLPGRASSERSHCAYTLVLCAYVLSYAIGEYAVGTARPSPRVDMCQSGACTR